MSSLDRILPFLKPIEDVLRDPSVTEVMVNAGGARVFVERNGKVECVPDRVLERRNLTVAIKNIARACGDEISEAQPMLDCYQLRVVMPRSTISTYERLLEAARSIDWRTYLIALLGGEGGMRVGEIVALEWADIDLKRRQISIRHSDWRGQLTSPKNGRGRFVAMTERVASALRKHRHLGSSRVLCQDDGQPITRQGAWSRVRYAAHRANMPTGVHILRHTFCSHLVMRGAAMRSVQELVGHQDLTMTQRYSHLSPAALIDTIRLLESRAGQSDRGEILETVEGRDWKLKS